jgi:hypothetical protein
MSRPRAHRVKTYKQRPVMPWGGLGIIADRAMAAQDQQTMHTDDQVDLNIAYWLAMNTMLTGASTEQDWSVVVCALNIALILTERGLGAEFEPYMVKALTGAFRAKIRGDRTGVWRFDGEAINDIRAALEIHDEQVKIANRLELREAILEVYRRIDVKNVFEVAA